MGNSKLSTNRGDDDIDNFAKKTGAVTASTITTMGDVIPDDISILILEFASDSLSSVQQLTLVSKRWYTLLMQATNQPSKKAVISATNDCHARTNLIWKQLALPKWDVAEDINIKNWQKFYQRRKTYIDDNKHRDFHLIENCEDIETNCPMEYEKLVKFWNPNKIEASQSSLHCSKCNKTVYKCETREEVVDHKRQGYCVAFIEAHLPVPDILMFRVG